MADPHRIKKAESFLALPSLLIRSNFRKNSPANHLKLEVEGRFKEKNGLTAVAAGFILD
jgi:hypothetical protein